MIKQLKDDLTSAINQVKYCEDMISSNIEEWERKEYILVLEDNKKQIESLKYRIDFLMN